ncbi:hypothetical protein B5X24_HaOG204091 [Helicoverpa armigera]|uniref:Uncharacterized protein n=1 Tax=Helicoverpa armigera TaxID=29058 RepID=A0A2W1BW23_HELAM|nr:hypothetical protein B5X24_HaOG204091 [Helicoverpa armigera]
MLAIPSKIVTFTSQLMIYPLLTMSEKIMSMRKRREQMAASHVSESFQKTITVVPQKRSQTTLNTCLKMTDYDVEIRSVLQPNFFRRVFNGCLNF